jgi:group II intron reverse transcriptase/maturase
MQFIVSKQNILLAYRNIKKNKGSITPGTDGLNIEFIENMGIENYIKYIQYKFENYQPKSVRGVEIPKKNGETRHLGIPCMDDRIIQQCIKQILEPICEAKFHKHSYGFRPNRSTSHAIARCYRLINRAGLHYVIDIDIKSFFDSVSHAKLKKQMWNIGIQDKSLISIIGKMLKSEIQGKIPTKGTPQGGIISPLLSNIVLNELDWWISDQWETFKTNHTYAGLHKYRAMKTTKLKEVWLVRYADDFKLFCRDYKTAQKIYNATRLWLKERLDLEINFEKSKITNLRRNYTEYLGFKLIAKPKRNKYACQSRMCDKALQNTIRKLKQQIKVIQKEQTAKEISKLNSIILGSHNYYKSATNISLDFGKINFLVMKTLNARLKNLISEKPELSETYKRFYGNYRGKIRTIKGITIFPIYGCRTKPPMCFPKDICNYTEEGRKNIHVKLKGYSRMILYLLNNVSKGNSTEFNDNRISLLVGQQGRCHVTGELLNIGNMECHHKIPKRLGGNDSYENLTWIKVEVHELIHAVKEKTIDKYLGLLNLNKMGLKRVNSLRKLVGNSAI